MTERHTAYFQSEIGWLEIDGTEAGLTAVSFVEERDVERGEQFDDQPLPACVQACRQQLAEYFNGERQEFSLPLAPEGTAFQQKVWRAVRRVPFNKTASYLEIARATGDEKAVRAVGNANGRNPIVIIIPCHRIIGSNGQLTGYGGGLWRKAWLLRHEQSIAVGQQMRLF